jgi:hypothetical protein
VCAFLISIARPIPAYFTTFDLIVQTIFGEKKTVFWVVAPCSLVEVYHRFRGPCCLYIRAMSKPRAWKRLNIL